MLQTKSFFEKKYQKKYFIKHHFKKKVPNKVPVPKKKKFFFFKKIFVCFRELRFLLKNVVFFRRFFQKRIWLVLFFPQKGTFLASS